MINTNTLIWIVVAWLMTAFFSGLEVAFVTANRLHIELKKKQGLRTGIILSGFMESPARFIGTTLVGFNLFLVVFGLMVGEALLPFWNWAITKLHYSQRVCECGPSIYRDTCRIRLHPALRRVYSKGIIPRQS